MSVSKLASKIADAGGLSFSDAAFAARYLTHYGYVGADSPDLLPKGVKSFQRLLGLKADGIPGPKTRRAMNAKRCALPDHAMMRQESRWRKHDLNYFVESYVGGMPRGDQDDLIKIGLSGSQGWGGVADLRFTRVASKSKADLLLSTGRGRRDGFDGPGGVLAYAYMPQGDGRQLLMRMDLDEQWVKDARDPGTLYLNVMEHELGHMLGLDHSRVRGALLFPYYSPAVAFPQPNDDIKRIQQLYGKPKPTEPTPTPDPEQPPSDRVTIHIDGARHIEIPGWKVTRAVSRTRRKQVAKR